VESEVGHSCNRGIEEMVSSTLVWSDGCYGFLNLSDFAEFVIVTAICWSQMQKSKTVIMKMTIQLKCTYPQLIKFL